MKPRQTKSSKPAPNNIGKAASKPSAKSLATAAAAQAPIPPSRKTGAPRGRSETRAT